MKRPVKGEHGISETALKESQVGQGSAFSFSCEIFPLPGEELMT